MLQLKVLVLELGSIDALTTCAITSREVAALNHELLDDAVELGALVVQGLASLSHALLTSAESAEVLCSAGHNVGVEFHDDAAGLALADLNVEEYTAARRGSRLVVLRGHCGVGSGVIAERKEDLTT